MALRGVGFDGRGLDDDDGTGGKRVFERERGGTGGASSLCRENDKLVIEKFIDFDFFKENDFFRSTAG